ncbi:MAG: hypothetical protein ACI85O_003647 [Saprospiraceae bacterium]|jgi:hypothetical protein
MKRFRLLTFFLLIALLNISCNSDPKLAYPSDSNEQLLYDFFNDIRLQVSVLEPGRKQLQGWTRETKQYLENAGAQKLYKTAGLYFELNKNREKGAHDYADRFFDNGCQIHIIVYPPEQHKRYSENIGRRKTYGRQLGKHSVLYQVFTAQPDNPALEDDIKTIIESVMEKYDPEMRD